MIVAALTGGALADAQLQATPEVDDPHLLVVPATPEGEAALARADARLIARYKAFSVVEAAGADDERLRQAGAKRRDDMHTVRTAAGRLDPKTRRRSLAGKEAPRRDEVLALVQFVGPPKDAWLERVRSTSARIVTYQAENSYVVHASGEEVDRLAALVGSYAPVRTVAVLTAADKLESPQSATGRYAVQTVSGAEGEQARDDAAAAGAGVGRSVGLGQLHTLYLALSSAEAAELARDPAVVAVEPYGSPELADERGAQIVAGNLTGFAPSGSGYLNWLINPSRIPNDNDFSFAIDVSDEGLDGGTNPPAHSDFLSKGSGASRVAYFKNYSSDAVGSTVRDCGGHGTNVASIATGYNNATGPLVEDSVGGYNHGLGVAPFAKVGASKVFNCAGGFSSGFSAATLASEAYLAGARISNNSWGTGEPDGWGDYNALAQQYDALVRDARGSDPGNQELVEVFAAGNDGEDSPGDGPNEGYGTILAEGTAKNVITVGAAEGVRASGLDGCGVADSGADSARDIIDFASRGPTDDGRLKPDLVAPGTHMTGARPRHSAYTGSGACVPFFGGSSAFYSLISGSSQAAPQVSGAAALVRHWYNRTHPGTNPSPALTKALLVNTATDLAGGSTGKGATIAGGPNTDQGWGRVNVGAALDSTPREFRDQADTLGAAGEIVRKTYAVQDPAKPVKVTLVWTDAPGPTIGNAWVNNLDLEVEARGERYLGNVFADAFSRTGGSADTRNNVESVFLREPSSGRFAVTVKSLSVGGNGVPGNGDATDQDFALVVSNAVEQDAPVLVHSATTLADPAPGGDGDGVLESDEEIELTEEVRNAGIVAAGGLSATLSESSAGFNITQSTSPYAGLAPDASGLNSTAFEAELENASTCGVDVLPTLTITTTTPSVETHTIPLVLPTGEPGASLTTSANAPQVPLAIPDDSGTGVSSTVFVAPRGRIKDLNVRLPGTALNPAIEHAFLGDVVIDLIGPDGTTVRLAEHPGGPDNFGKDFVDVTFDDQGSLRLGAPDDPIAAQRPPYSGSFTPQNDQLSRFDGKDRRGNWTLRVRDLFETDTGTLRAWGLASQKALCDFDTTPPDTSLVGFPGTPVADPSPTFAFSSSEAGVTFECQLDSADYEPCTSPNTYSSVPDGLHNFRVRAVDGSDNEDATPAQHTWTIDTSPPDTTITGGPLAGSFSSSTGASFTFASEPQARFECSLDGAPFTGCADPQPQSYTGLLEGPHTFRVRAIDLAENIDPTPATRSWTVDTTAPIPAVTGPTGTTVDSEPLLTGTAGIAPGDLGTVTVKVYLGSGHSGSPPPAALERTLTASVNPATGAWSVEAVPALTLGDHTVQVQQNDSAGNLPGLSALSVFTVISDSVAPIVTLTQPVNGSSTADTTPTLAGVAGTLDGDDSTVTLKLWNGTLAAGLPAQTLIVPRDGASGAFSALPAALAEGTYSVRAEQGDSALNDQGLPSENIGVSGSATFTVSIPDPPKPPPAAAVAPSFALAPSEERLSDALANRYAVLAACDSACRVNAELTVSAETARKLGMKARAVAIGDGVERLSKAGAASVKVRLTPTARKALRGRTRSSATLNVIVRDADGTALKLKRTVTLRRSAGLKRAVSRGISLWTVCSKSCALRGALRISAASARELGMKAKSGERVTIASGRATTGPSPKKLTLTVPSSAKKALRGAKRLTALLEVSTGSASTGQRSARRWLTLR